MSEKRTAGQMGVGATSELYDTISRVIVCTAHAVSKLLESATCISLKYL